MNSGTTPASVGPVDLSADSRWSVDSGGLISSNCFKAASFATVGHSILSPSGAFDFNGMSVGFTYRYWVKCDNNGNLENLIIANGVISGASFSNTDWFVDKRFVNPNDHYGGQFPKGSDPNTLIYADSVFPDDLVWHRCVVICDKANKKISWKMDNLTTISTTEATGFSFLNMATQLCIQGDGLSSARHLNVCEVGLWQNILLTEDELLLDWNNGNGKTFP